ncbi:MAG: peptidoglycan bridge formation glycyltransferase FemA/FemB family protein [Candidatus Gracilibacteria bacterium]
MYKLKEILNKKTWNNFIIDSDFNFYSFLQSWQWGELQELAGKEISRYGIYDENKLIGILLIIKVRARRGNYYLVPHGPLIKGNYFQVLGSIIDQLKEYALFDKMCFIRFNSAVENTKENRKKFKKLKFINAPMHEHAEDTNLLQLSLSETKLLQQIKKKNRYYINRAIKEGVEIRRDNSVEHINKLIEMHHKHAKRVDGKNKYQPFSIKFIKNLYKVFGDDVHTLSASYEGEIESILMTIKFGKTCVYYIAASNIRHPKFSPNYLCQWSAIINAKKHGCTVYNFWGVSPDDNPKHPISSVTKFKRKFSGSDHSLLHAQDLILSKKYYINWIIETFRRIKRGYYYKKPE